MSSEAIPRVMANLSGLAELTLLLTNALREPLLPRQVADTPGIPRPARRGDPNHLSGYGNWTDQNINVDQGVADYSTQWNEYFTKEHDAAGLRSEANILRYFPVDKVFVRCSDPTVPQIDLLREASALTGVPLEISVDSDESEVAFGNRMQQSRGEVRLRVLTPATVDLYELANKAGVTIDTAPVTGSGRLELTHWVKEQSISRTMHRYGRLLNQS